MKYRKKPEVPVTIEAIKYTGDNYAEILEFAHDAIKSYSGIDCSIVLSTCNGDIVANVGDYIMKRGYRDFYRCKPGIFETTYELEGV